MGVGGLDLETRNTQIHFPLLRGNANDDDDDKVQNSRYRIDLTTKKNSFDIPIFLDKVFYTLSRKTHNLDCHADFPLAGYLMEGKIGKMSRIQPRGFPFF